VKQMITIKRTAATVATGLGLVVGAAGAVGASSGTIADTGNDSYNKVEVSSAQKYRVWNNNNLSAVNTNSQSAESGEAEVEDNRTGGNATSGAAANTNSFKASVTVANHTPSGGGSAPNHSGTIRDTGNDSYNKVEVSSYSSTKVTNNNNLSLVNTNSQSATSGDAEVEDNRTGGDAKTGNATNTNSSTVTFNVSN